MKRINIVLGVGSLIAVLAIGGVLLLGKSHGTADGTCASGPPITHQVVIQNDKTSPATTEGKLCDKITFTNKDNISREIGFGPHEHHEPYDGVGERVISKDQSFTITLNKAGTYHYHDHLHDEVEGYFIVSK